MLNIFLPHSSQQEGTCGPTAMFTEDDNFGKEKESTLSSKESKLTSAKSTDLQVLYIPLEM